MIGDPSRETATEVARAVIHVALDTLPDWLLDATCGSTDDPEAFLLDPSLYDGDQRVALSDEDTDRYEWARAKCGTCLVQAECRAWADTFTCQPAGLYGGENWRERGGAAERRVNQVADAQARLRERKAAGHVVDPARAANGRKGSDKTNAARAADQGTP